MNKICRTCGEEKPLTDFYKHPQMLDGHLNMCRPCVRARVRRHRLLNDHVREYDRQRGNRQTKKQQRAFFGNSPEAKRAHIKVRRAVLKGALAKTPCIFCGSEENLHAHHRRYDSPLDVTWLCCRCHRRLHAMMSSHTMLIRKSPIGARD